MRPARWWGLAAILLVALGLRLWSFAGLTLGDDPNYANLVNLIVKSGFPTAEGNPLAVRPLVLGPMALAVRFFGWSEIALVAPTLIASLLGISAAYLLGVLLESPAVGAVSALTIAVFPLDVIHSTTITNDIVGSTVVGWGAVAGCVALRARPDRTFAAYAAGVLLALALAVKLSFAVPALAVLGLIVWVAVRERQTALVVRPLVIGYALGLVALAVFFLVTMHDPVAPLSVELDFNRRFMLGYLLKERFNVLMSYPRWALLLQPADPVMGRLAPYGLLFPLMLLALTRRGLLSSVRVALTPLWVVTVLVWLELGPLQLWPYAPIHRLPRFLHAAAIPAGVTIGGWLVSNWEARGVRRTLSAVAYVAYLASALRAVDIMRWRQQDTMNDMRMAAAIAARYDGPVVTDNELFNYLAIRRGYQRMDLLLETSPPSVVVPQNALIIVGGSRRSELDPRWVVASLPKSVPEDWELVTRLSVRAEPWRVVPGVVYRNRGPAARVALMGQ